MQLSQNLIAAFPTLARRLDPSLAAAPVASVPAPAPNGLGRDVWTPTTLPAPLDTRLNDMKKQLHALLEASKTATPAPAPTPATYTVQKGDSLSKIAQALLGDGSRWPELYAANRDILSDPNLIHPDQQLKIPGAQAAVVENKPTEAAVNPTPAPAFAAKGALAALGISLTDEEIAKATGAPLENVKTNLPYIVAALKEHGITSEDAVIAVLATVAVETGNFKPIVEQASGNAYEGRKTLGNTQPGDGPRFKGRGYIQLTGRDNYDRYGKKLGIDLVNNPDRALDPKIAAQILALYFKDRNIAAKAEQGDVRGVRLAVNGGTNGLARFETAINKLEAYA